jgi:P-type Cu2+ transporter
VWGVWNTVRGTGEIYFDSLSVLVFALLAGRWIQHRQQRSSADSVELLFSLTPSSVRLVRGAAVVETPLEAVQTGDTLDVLVGDSFPADGTLTEGSTLIDQSLLTGESVPAPAAEGDAVHAGSVNLGGRVRMLVKATGEATRVGRLLAMVQESSRRRAPIVRMADRVAGWFVAAMLVLATGTAAAWFWIDPSRAIDHAAALLIVTCPCALGLATPLAITVAVGRAARRGILIKGGDSLQAMASPQGTILLDKTGTITEARTRLVRWVGPEELKPIVAAVEAGSSHLIARALAAAADGPLPLAMQVKSSSRGIEGTVGGRLISIGSTAWVRTLDDSGSLLAAEGDMARAGLTPVLIAVDRRIAAVAGVGDPVRPGSKEAIAALGRMGWRVGILSGDHPDVVAAVGRQMGLESRHVIGGATPETKREVVEGIARHEFVVMVGDGVNDAAAMAAASVGIAVHGGAEASLAAADVYLSRPGLAPIVELARASRRTMGVIRRNLAASLFYNALAAGLAVTGLINPLLAAILMPLSSLTVLTLSFRSRTFGDKPCP